MGTGGRARHAFRPKQHNRELHPPLAGCPHHPQVPQTGDRSYLTLLPLSQRLGMAILAELAVDAHPTKIVESLVAMETAVALLCWEHDHLVKIACAVAHTMPVANPADVPTSWPDDRFDVIWRFDRDEQTQTWAFGSHDQQLLAGDSFPSEPVNHREDPAAGWF